MHFPHALGSVFPSAGISQQECSSEPSFAPRVTQNCMVDVPCFDAWDGVEDMFDHIREQVDESQRQVQAFLDESREWMPSHCSVAQVAPHKPLKMLRFAAKVEIHVTHRQEVVSCLLDQYQAHETLRKCWNMNSNNSSMALVKNVLSNAHQHHAMHLDTDPIRTSDTSHENGGTTETDVGLGQETQVWAHLTTSCLSCSRRSRVATWFLRTGDHTVCERSRDVTVVPGMSLVQFMQECRTLWADVVSPDQIALHQVRDAPQTSPGIRAHVILAQRAQPAQVAHLAHWDQWPVLFKFRAVLFESGQTVQQVLDQVRFDGNALHVNVRYGMFFRQNEGTVHLGDDDRLELQSSAVLYGFPQHLPEEDSDESQESSVDAQGSTVMPQSDDESSEEDVVSWVATRAIRECFDSRDPYPWENDTVGQHDTDDEFWRIGIS